MQSLVDYVAKHGGPRFTLHPGMRDNLVRWGVEEFPEGAETMSRTQLEDVLRSRLAVRLRKQGHGSVLVAFITQLFIVAIVRMTLDWWFAKPGHRVLMAGWRRDAAKGS